MHMFDRNARKFTSSRDWRKDLPRFNDDEFAAMYLAGVYNPEFKIRVAKPKSTPRLSATGICFRFGGRRFNKAEDVY